MHTRSKGNKHLLVSLESISTPPRQFRERVTVQEDHIMAEPPNNNLPAQQAHAVPRGPRQIGAGDAPRTHTQRQGIVPPAVQNNHFEIKSGLISMVQGNKFHGLPMEDPLDHLDEFDRLCSLTRINGVSEDGFKLRLFPFSLGDKAHLWEKSLLPGSITSWDECKKAFLGKFFSNARTARLRNEISGFTQKNSETFCEAWERFKKATSQCPHHGFSNESLLSTLYRGALPKIRMLLDTASNGNFLNKDVDEGWELVENLAQSDGNYNEEYDRSVRGPSESDDKTKREIKSLHEKIDKLLLVHQRSVNFVGEEGDCQEQVGEVEKLEEACYVQNQGGYNKAYNNYKPNPNLSYRNPNVANPNDQTYPPQNQPKPFIPYQPKPPTLNPPPGFVQPQSTEPDLKGMLNQILQGQVNGAMETAKRLADLKNHIDNSYDDLHSKIDGINTRLTALEAKGSTPSNSMPSGQLPGKAIQNPKDFAHVHAITIQAGRELPVPMGRTSITGDSDVQVGEGPIEDLGTNAITRPANSTSGVESEPLGPVNSTTEAESVSLEQPHSPKRIELPPLGRLPFLAQLPYPGRFRGEIRELCLAQVDEFIARITKVMPLRKAYDLLPPGSPFLKNLLVMRMEEAEARDKEEADRLVKEEEEKIAKEEAEAKAKAMIQERTPPLKLDDPGSFTLPCSLGDYTFHNSLCDLGAAVSLMPLSVATKLGYKEYKPCGFTLMLADRTCRLPHGILENVPVRIGDTKVPADFIVLKMDKEPKDPIILGRPFLATVGATINVKKGIIELELGEDHKVVFDIKASRTKPTVDGQPFSIGESCYLGVETKLVDNEEDPPDPLALKLDLEEPLESPKVFDWEYEKEYPPEEEEAYLAERAIEYDGRFLSQEDVDPDGLVLDDDGWFTFDMFRGNCLVTNEGQEGRIFEPPIQPD